MKLSEFTRAGPAFLSGAPGESGPSRVHPNPMAGFSSPTMDAVNVVETASLLKKRRMSGVSVVDDEKRLLGPGGHEELMSVSTPHHLSIFDEPASWSTGGRCSFRSSTRTTGSRAWSAEATSAGR